MTVIPARIPTQMTYECGACGHQQAFTLPTPQCEKCGHAWLDVHYDYDRIKEIWPAVLRDRPFSMWRYRELLPLRNDQYQISMGEGGTPLIRADNLGMMLGAPNIYIKDERQNPTNSFKDRQAGLVISLMKEAGIKELVVASTGNVAISYSAYSTHAGIKLWTFLPSLVPPEKMREIAIYGSEVIKVTDNYDAAKLVAAEFAQHKGILADGGIRNIGTRESMKTIAFEVAEQLAEMRGPAKSGTPWRAPDWYIQAVSGGMGPIGFYKGFVELYEMGLVDKIPKLALIQVDGCAPMVNSFRKGLEKAENVEDPQTRVITIATGRPGMAYSYLRKAMLETGGVFESVSDEEAFRALHVLAKMEGFSIEAAAATSFAGLFKLLNKGVIDRNETILVNCSGHTFPVEKFLLDEDWLKVVDPSAHRDRDASSSVREPRKPAPAESEGLVGALDQLDSRVKRIAIIEDNRDAARLLRRILQTRGNFQLYEAHTGKEGIELINREKPDLVLLDLMMPDIDGFGVLDAVKDDPETQDLPVIVITAKELTKKDTERLAGQTRKVLQKGSFMDEDLLDGITDIINEITEGNEP